MRRPRIRDDLTSLPLRATLHYDFKRRQAAHPLSLLLCDLDHLKLVNDTLGHLAGDQALQTLAAGLQSRLKPGWGAYRFGGDEFAVLAPVDAAALKAWADHLLADLAQADQPTQLTISFSGGIAEVPASADLTAVVAQADQRLYAAKRRGKAQVIHCDAPSSFEQPLHRLLDREDAFAQASALLVAAQRSPAEVQVQALPGSGLSAFLEQLGVVARTLGYQTLRLCGSQARQCQHLGAWAYASLDGQPPAPLDASGFRARQPLAVLLDTPERFDAGSLAALDRLLAQAQVVVRGQINERSSHRAGEAVYLGPLRSEVMDAFFAGQPGLDLAARQWLWQRSGGRPAELHRWLRALGLEAALRCQSISQMLQGEGDWEETLRHQFGAALLWPRPLLYGRSAELQDAAQRLDRASLLTITGPPGRGKTRFAEQLLGELTSAFGRVHSLTLPEAGEALLPRLAEVLLGRPSQHVDCAGVGRILARQPSLLLIDAPSGQAVPVGILESLLDYAPLSRFVVTSDAPLGARHESVLPLGLLPHAAVRCALEQPRGALSPDELIIAVNWVGGEPLRLEALGGLLRRAETPQACAALLASLQELDLPESGSGAALLLGQHERQVLAALKGASGPINLAWAEHLSGASPFLLEALRSHNYLQAVGGGLYRLSGAVSQTAQTTWKASPALRRRVGRQALGRLKESLGTPRPGSAAWFSKLDQDYPSLRAVTAGQLSAQRPSRDHAEVLLALTPYRLSRGYLHEARSELERVLHRSPALTAGLRQQLSLALANVLQHLGEHPAAQELLRQLPRDERWRVPIALTEARVLHRRSQYQQSHALFGWVSGQADLTAEQAVRAQDGLARSAIYLGQLTEARQQSAAAEQQLVDLDDPLLLSEVLNTAALVAAEQRELERAEELFGKALKIHQTFGHRQGLTLNLTGLAWTALLSGDFGRSAVLSRQVLRQAQDAGQAWEIANALINLGHALTKGGELEQARHVYRQGEQLATQHDAPSLVAEALGGLAEVLSLQGSSEQARQLLSTALSHPGANAEMQQFFEPLRAQLQPSAAPAATPTAFLQA